MVYPSCERARLALGIGTGGAETGPDVMPQVGLREGAARASVVERLRDGPP